MSHPMLSRKPLNAWLKDLLGVAAGLGAAAPLAAFANPTGGHVVAGSASISNPSANGTVVHQNTQGAIINWQQFSIGSGQYVQFVQPSSSAVVLNRVTGGNASVILGNITANGQVFLVNPFGILFGKSAVVDAQGFVASTLDLSNSDFMHSHYAFVKDSGAPDASVVNQGSLSGARGGYVVLMGDYVENDGVINAENGRVVLAAGGGALLTLGNDDLISYKVDKATLARLAGVDNAGRITADGGGVVMTADVANALTATAVNNSGFVAAHSIKSENGVIVLSARGGDIEDSGTLDASATQAGVKGGDIIIRGDGHTEIAASALIQTQGDHAKGGFIELSGHTLALRGQVAAGRGGDLLIDPSRINIVAGGGILQASVGTGSIGTGFIDTKLNAGSNVTIVASNSIGHVGGTSITATGAGNLKIATGSVPIGGSCGIGDICVGTLLPTITHQSGTINLTGLTINIKGAFTADASHGNVIVNNVTAAKGIVLTGHTISAGALSASNGAVTLTGNGNAPPGNGITVTGNIKGKSVTLTENLPSTASYGGNINVTGSIDATAGSISISAVTTAPQSMNIVVHNLTASKAVTLSQEGHRGRISFGNVIAGSGGSATHVGLKVSTVTLGPSASGGNISGGKVTATGGVQLQTNVIGAGGRGGNVNMSSIQGKYISINAHAASGASVNVGALHAVGTATNDGVSVFASDSAGNNGANIKVSGGGIRANKGGVTLHAQGGSDSGGNVIVNGAISAAGLVNILAVNEGCCGGSVVINSGGVKGKFINIQARDAQASNLSGARIVIHGNVTATGTAPPLSPSVGVFLEAGSAGVPNGAPSIDVHGNVTASHGVVNLIVAGNNGGRTITLGSSSGGAWVKGAVKAQRVNISVGGAGAGGNIDVGAITTLGSGFNGGASIQAGGGLGGGHITVHGGITIGGSDLFIDAHGGGTRSVTVTGAINVAGPFGAVNLTASGNSTTHGGRITAGNITAKDVRLFADGGGKSGAAITLGNLAANSISLGALNHHGGSAVISAGKLTASHINVNASAAAASGQAAHITLGAITAVNANGDAGVGIFASGKANSVSLSTVTVSGHAQFSPNEAGPPTLNPVGARFEVITRGGSSDAININGNVTVSAFAATSSPVGGDAVVAIAAFTGSGSKAVPAKLMANINGNLTVNAARDAHLLVHGSASGALAVKAGRSIDDTLPASEGGSGNMPLLVLDASAIALQAGANIKLSGASLGVVGSAGTGGIAGDHVVTNLFGLGSIAPNAAFIAGGTLNLGNVSGSINYLLIEAGAIGTLGTLTLNSGALVQLTTANATDTLGVGNGAGTTVYSAADITQFAGDNVVIGGSALTGTMTVGTANLGSMAITLLDNGTIKSSGLLTAGSLTLVAGVGKVDVTTDTASVTVVSGASVLVDNTAFTGSATLAVANANASSIGNLTFEFGGDGMLATDVSIAGGLTLLAGGNLDISGRKITAPLQVQLVAGFQGPNQALLAKNITLTGVDINTKVFSAAAGGSILDAGTAGTITANGLFMSAVQGNIDLHNTQLNIGSGSVSGVIGDPSAAAVLALAGLLGGNFKPNGTFVAGGGTITLGGLDFSGNYLYLQADSINILGTVATTPGAVIQLAPFTPTHSIGIENTTPNGDDSNFLNQNLLGLFAGDTILIGRTGESGAVDLGTNGPFTLAPGTNLIIDTSGVVTGLSTVTSTGLVTTLDALFSSISFQPPTAGEIDPTSGSNSDAQQKKQELIEFIEGGGQGGGTITQDTGTASVCH